jgi:hydrogenase/urease accessory protein HupE
LRRAIGIALALTTCLVPASADAHGIGEDAAGRTVLEYIPFGTEHMLLGWDHLLFVFGVVLLAGTVLRAAKLLSLFVAGHSLTLIVASLAGWSVNATAVDIVIALSVVFVGIVGIRGQPEDWRWFGAAVFGFGLVHGLGLATRLQDAGLPDDGILLKVLAFNLGVEIGQILAVGAVVALGYLLTRETTKDMSEVRRIAFVLVAVGGLVGVAVLSLPGPEDEGETTAIASGCEESAPASLPFNPAASHPERTFYEPGDPVDEDNLNHVVGDGFLIVRYSDDLSAKQVGELRRWHEAAPEFVVAAPDADQEEAIRTLTRDGTLTCGELDVDALAEYSDSWFEGLGQA